MGNREFIENGGYGADFDRVMLGTKETAQLRRALGQWITETVLSSGGDHEQTDHRSEQAAIHRETSRAESTG